MSDSGQVTGGRLRVLCWNVHLFGRSGTARMTLDEEARADRVAAFVAAADCDVVGLCEVWDEALVARIRERLAGTPIAAHSAQGPVFGRTRRAAAFTVALVAAFAAAAWWVAGWAHWGGGPARVVAAVVAGALGVVAAVELAGKLKVLGSG